MTTAQLLILAVLGTSSLAAGGLGCAAGGARRTAAPEVAPDPQDAARLLSRCERLAQDPDVTAWDCGKLTAVETVVRSATQREVAMAFDGFAASFGGDSARRVDSVYARGEARHAAMRLEGRGPGGEQLEAQMVAVALGNGVRLVTCSTRDAGTPCAPVVAHLVYDTP